MEDFSPYDNKVLKLIKTDGFIQEFETELTRSNGRTYKQVFTDLNNVYRKYFQKPRYSSYDSFRTIRARRIKK